MKSLIIVRGGGDLATGVIHRLHQSGFPVLVLESDKPSAIRRQVSFCEAVYDGSSTVEQVTCVKIDNLNDLHAVQNVDVASVPQGIGGQQGINRDTEELIKCEAAWCRGEIPLLVDPSGEAIRRYKPQVVVDAMIAKKNLGTDKGMAPVTIGLGPGFTAGVDVHYVIETKRGHNLGRIITEGCAAPNTGIPGMVGGYSRERVIHAPAGGFIAPLKQIGDKVVKGEKIALIEDVPVYASLTGILRGMIREYYQVYKGMKIADIDPREEEYANCFTISDKARCIAGSVLEIVCRHWNS